MIEPLNYCRQMRKQFSDAISAPSFPRANREVLSHFIDLCVASQKFMLPNTGVILDDEDYRALDHSEPIHLPFPIIALEYSYVVPKDKRPSGLAASSKRIVFCRERDDAVVLSPAFWSDSDGVWCPMPEVAIPRKDYLAKNPFPEDGRRTGVLIHQADPRIPRDDYADEVIAFMSFLNVLKCRNVQTEKVFPKRATKTPNGALPFDTYHVLTVDTSMRDAATATGSGTHRSPREHLRRGHIRRYASGLRLWINATVVNAGRGGVVSKDYAFR